MFHMIKKRYDLDIAEQLRKHPSHIRELARSCHINQMAVLRTLKELEKENIVDFHQEGKNKVYFLKKNLETQEFLFMAEHGKFLQALHQYPRLRRIVEELRRRKEISLGIIFGSYAKGTVHGESDIDLYLETENRKLKEEFSLIDSKLSIKIGKFDPRTPLAKEIEKDHIIIKGVERHYEIIAAALERA